MAYSKAALKMARTAFNRSAGQYKRYYGIDPDIYLEGVHTPKGYERALESMRYDVEREKILAEVAEREAREAAERAKKEFEAELSINNYKDLLQQIPYQATISTAAMQAEERAAEALIAIIDRAVTIYGYIDTWERLAPYATATDQRLERLIIAIYDKQYNTNLRFGERDAQGEVGRRAFIRDIEQFAADLGVNAGVLAYSLVE